MIVVFFLYWFCIYLVWFASACFVIIFSITWDNQGPFWLEGRSDSKVVLTQRSFWLKGRSDSKAVLTRRPFWLSGGSDSKAVLTQRPFWLNGNSDSKAIGRKAWVLTSFSTNLQIRKCHRHSAMIVVLFAFYGLALSDGDIWLSLARWSANALYSWL